MNVICIDDEELILKLTVSMCKEISMVDEVEGFVSVEKALEYLEGHKADIALLDIDMPEMDGITLALKLKQLYPDISVIFVTGYSEYAVEAFKIHASDYLMKPINKARLEKELEYAVVQKSAAAPKPSSHIVAKTFGEFDLFVDGKIVTFKRAKAKELLAYLIDRQGGSITRTAAFSVLWEDREYDRTMQKQLDVVVRSLRDTLQEYGIGELLSIERGSMMIKDEMLDCDMYRFIKGDVEAINSFRGEYMNSYSWASLTEGLITNMLL
ncbi:MAG: response regulator [Eubacterium sp.]|nr:response regulator [Eubacterium sp.]MBR1675670.1 response regulator [Eubacterium sp.]